MSVYTIKDIVAYTSSDTQLLLNKLNHSYYTKIDITNPYRFGSIRLLEHLLKTKKILINSDTCKDGLYHACKSGNIKSIEFMITRGANDWNRGLHGACKGGRLPSRASASEHLDIVNLMISKGATECYYCNKSIEDHLK